MTEETNFKYTIVQSTTDEEFESFVGNGNIEAYDEPYQTYARYADSGATFSAEINGEQYGDLMVRVEPI